MQPHPVVAHRYSTAEEKPAFVRKLFESGAPFYDRVVGWGFLGTGTMYRRMAQRRAGLRPGMKVLDAAAGTGLMAQAASRLGIPAGDITCLDVSAAMLAGAREKLAVATVVASVDALPFADATFDFVMMGYALRHVASLEGALREFHRVLRANGRVLVLEITKPGAGFGNWCFRLWFRDVYPALSGVFTRSRSAREMMRYYWETMDTVVPPEAILQALRSAGFRRARRRIVGRIFSEYTAVKLAHDAAPAADEPPRMA